MLSFLSSPAAADWIVRSRLPWHQLVTFGPAGFDAYARLRLLPDPADPGRSENDVEAEDWRGAQMPRLLELLACRTTTPDDCCFCVWDGFAAYAAVPGPPSVPPSVPRSDAVPGLAPPPGGTVPPTVVVPHRAYWLFRGPLAESGAWETARGWPGGPRLHSAAPAFVWPADRAWCVTQDVDPHWAGIGGAASLIDELTGSAGLDVVPADPTRPPPAYR